MKCLPAAPRSVLLARVASVAVCAALAAAMPAAHAAKARKQPAAEQAAHHWPEASADQLQAAKYALVGQYQCEAGHVMTLDHDSAHPGYLTLRFKKSSWAMKPVLSPTGAIRIEELKGRAMLLQIAFKSMLMDVKSGQRIADNCVHASQRAAADAARGQAPAPSLINN